MPSSVGWVEAAAETHHNQLPMQWVSGDKAIIVCQNASSRLQIMQRQMQ